MTNSQPLIEANANNRPRDNDWRLFLRLIPYARSSGRLLLVSMLLLIPLAVSNAIQPFLIGQAISLIRQEPSTYEFLRNRPLMEGLYIVESVLLITITIRLILTGIQGYFVQKVGQQITAKIRDDLFYHVTSLAVRFFDRTPVGKLITRLTNDVEALGDVFATGAVGIVSDLFSMVVIIVFMFSIQWQLALLLLMMLVPITALIVYFQNQYRLANYKTREELSSLNSMLQENITGINVVQLFRREKFNAELFRKTNRNTSKKLTKQFFMIQRFQQL